MAVRDKPNSTVGMSKHCEGRENIMAARYSMTLCLLILSAGPGLSSEYSQCLQERQNSVQLRACEGAAANKELSAAQRSRAYREIGSIRAEAGAHAIAEKNFTKAIELSPNDAQAYAKRGQARLVLGQKKGAISDLSEATRLKPGSENYLIHRGYAYLVSGRIDEAIKDFSSVIARNPNSIIALNNRGLAYRKKGDLNGAIADYTAALSINPLYGRAYTNRGFAYEAQGKKDNAIADFRASLRIDPNQASVVKALKRLKATTTTSEVTTLVKAGAELAKKHCSRCHAVTNSGNSPNLKAPRFRNLQKRYALLDLREPISRGIAAPHDEMPSFKLSDAEIDKIVAYVNSLSAPR